jgi:hypothetical protein
VNFQKFTAFPENPQEREANFKISFIKYLNTDSLYSVEEFVTNKNKT